MSRQNVFYLNTEVTLQPPIDLYETEDELVFKIDLPGINPDEVLIKVFDDIVIIEGKRIERREEKSFKYICMERTTDSFRRVIHLPAAVNQQAGRAVYHEGVVTLTFPKIKDRVIKIRIER